MIREIILEINDEEITDRVLLKVLDEQFDAYGRLHDNKGQLTKIMLKAQNSDINLFTKQEEKKIEKNFKEIFRVFSSSSLY